MPNPNNDAGAAHPTQVRAAGRITARNDIDGMPWCGGEFERGAA